jgi:hypothetical protein
VASRFLEAALLGRLTAASSSLLLALHATRAEAGSSVANTFAEATRAKPVVPRKTALQHHFGQSISCREAPFESGVSPLGDRAMGKLLIRPDVVVPVEKRTQRQNTAAPLIRKRRWRMESNALSTVRAVDTSFPCTPDHMADRLHLTTAAVDWFARSGGTFSLKLINGSTHSRIKVGMTRGIGLEFGAVLLPFRKVIPNEIKKEWVGAFTP